jgi:hypothetical protein
MENRPRRSWQSLFPVLLLSAAIGCASPREAERDNTSLDTDAKGEPAEKYERLFNPADYDPSLAAIENLARSDTTGRSSDDSSAPPILEETIPGFRVQVLSTTEFDTVNAIKLALSTLPENLGIYVIFDSPYYKLRVGDFHSRPDANQLLKSLFKLGYADAWIVADRVLKNPPLRKPAPPH